MTTYLSMNGTSDYLNTPSLNYDEINITLMPTGSFNNYSKVASTSSGAYFQHNSGTTDSWSGFSGVSKNGTPGTSGTTMLVLNEKDTYDITRTAETLPIYFFQNQGLNTGYFRGNIYDIKIYKAGSLIAHYDMSTGTVNDQSGNGNNATLTGGTWLNDASGGGTNTAITATSKSSSNQTTTLSDSRALSGSVVKSSSSQVSATLSNQVKISGTWKSNTSQTAGMTDAVPVTLSSTVKSQSAVTLVSLLDSDGLSSTVKSNSSGNAAILLDRMAESTTVSSTSSEHDGMTVLRAMSTTVKSNTTASSASLSIYNGTWVLVDSNAKSNSSSSLASQVSKLMVSTVESQSIVTGGLRQNVNVLSTVLSATGTTNNVTIQGPIVRLVSRNRSNSFAKVASTMTKTNPKVTTKSFTKATGYLLNLQVVSQLIETIKFKRGNKASLPTLNVGEPAFTLDTDEMFVGSSTGNIKILGMIVETSVANLPSPSATNHWQICGVLGDGSTTADALYICKQLANGTYDWVQFA